MSKENYQTNPFYSENDVANTLCYTSEGVELVRTLLFKRDTEPSTLSPDAREGLLKLLATIHSALSSALGDQLNERIHETAPDHFERRWTGLKRLNEEQIEIVRHLVEDIADGRVDHRHLRDSRARIAFAKFEAATANLCAHAILARESLR